MKEQVNPRELSIFLNDLASNRELMFQAFEQFPLPIEVFTSDGTAVYLNRVMLEINNITDESLAIGKYNLLTDPVCNEILGHEFLEKVFSGEAIAYPDFPVPIQDLVDRGLTKEKPFESANMDLFFSPLFDGDKLAYVMCVFVVKRVYQDNSLVARAKEYIDGHWREEYDQNVLAKALEISVSQLYSVFKNTGMTPGDYYKLVKVAHIKEALADKNLTVAKAFAACGEDSKGWIRKVFKKVTGMSPKEYRASIK